MSSAQAAQIIKYAFRKIAPDLELSVLPLVDGGQGFVDHCTRALGGKIRRQRVTGPLFRPIQAKYGLAWEEESGRKIAVIEMAQIAGLTLIPEHKRNPLRTTTYGVGELAAAAIRQGSGKIIIGCGDSATMDCGLGALSALGVRFLNHRDRSVELTARGLIELARIDCSRLTSDIANVEWVAAFDVDNPLTGKKGALMYCRQKGADARMKRHLEEGLHNFCQVVRRQFGINLDRQAGAGAAGGLAAGLAAVLGAELISGFEFYKKITRLDEEVKKADWIITGEGRLDEQTFHGKAAHRLVKLAENNFKPVTFFTGSLVPSPAVKQFNRMHQLVILRKPGVSIKTAIAKARHLLMFNALIQARCLQVMASG